MTMTVTKLKKWAKSNKKLAEAVRKARVFAQSERERVDAYTRPIFETYEFRTPEGERITDPEKLYLCEDDELCASYYSALDAAHREHGFDGPAGYCPALVAKEAARQAEQALLDSLGEFAGVAGSEFNHSLKRRAEALDIALGCCLGDLC